MTLHPFLAAAAALVVLAATPMPVRAQLAYPQSRVTLVTHSSPGGGSDVFLRDLARHLGPVMGVNLQRREHQRRQRRARDGHGGARQARWQRLLRHHAHLHPDHAASKPEVGYTALEPVAIVFEDPEVIFTRTAGPFRTLAEVVDFAKKNPARRAGARPIPRRWSASRWSA